MNQREWRDELDGPGGELARAIAALWAELFDDPDLRVAPDDDFFRLGGSSLLAIEFLALLQDRLNIRISMLAFAEAATLRALVAEATRRRGERWEDGEIP